MLRTGIRCVVLIVLFVRIATVRAQSDPADAAETAHFDMDFTLPDEPVAQPEELPAAPPDVTSPEATPLEAEHGPERDATPDRAASLDAEEPAHPTAEMQASAPTLEWVTGIQLVTRDAQFDNRLHRMAEQTLDPTPVLRTQLRWYPAAAADGLLANVGIEFHAALMWPVVATGEVGSFKTTSSEFGAAARLRIALGSHQLGLFAGYATHRVEVTASDDAVVELPSVAYGFVRGGADVRLQLGPSIGLGAEAAVSPLLSYGPFGQRSWFPRASGLGLQAQLRADYAVTGSLALEVNLGITRYATSLHARSSDAIVERTHALADRFVDQYLGGMLGLRLQL